MAEDVKQNTLWWIASIAVSVLCCAALFVVFASYLVEVKADIKDSNMRMNAIETREDAILTNIEAMRKPAAPDAAAAAPAEAAPDATASPATMAPADMSAAPAAMAPTTSPTAAPDASATPAAPAAPPANH